MKKHKTLTASEVFKKYDLKKYKFKTTKELELCKEMIGQQRATSSVMFGLGIKKHGYNLYLAGESGLGKKSFIRNVLKNIADNEPVPDDWCYLYNFENPKEPKSISLPPGKGKQFKKDMDELVNILSIDLPKAFESKEFEQERNKLTDKFNAIKEEHFKILREFGAKNEIQIQFTPTGIFTVPLVKNNPVQHQQFDQLDEKTRNRLTENKKLVDSQVAATLLQVRKIDKDFMDAVKELENKVASFTVRGHIESLLDKYAKQPDIIKHLKAVQNDIATNIEKFLPQKKSMMPGMPFGQAANNQPDFNRLLTEYKVNVFIDNSNTKGAPVVFETQPHYLNLYGSVEREFVMGAMVTNFTLISGGSICTANGGYLVVDAVDILKFPFVWDTMKKILENGEHRVEDMYQQYGYTSGVGLKPEPIDIELKVIIIGPSYLYHLLYNYDPDFKKLFKIKADFDTVITNGANNLREYACVIKSICQNEKIKDLEKSGVERLMEYSSRLSGDQEKFSVHFGKISKVLVEADYWATVNKSKFINAEHLEKAINEKIYRSNMIEEKIQELIVKGSLMLDTTGEVVGQINGLSVYNMGDYAFGKPTRITCETFMGNEGIVNIERRVKLSGNIHDKGVMILSGFLGRKFAQDKPLSLSASIGFEQSYEVIDGDSASAAELITLLSSIADIPIKQNFAITGSVNQKGSIQPIGGVNEKIEGFFDICKANGLTGTQSVIIPHQNVKNLMLKKEIVEAIKSKKFHIYPIKTIDDGIEILTGIEAGKRKANGQFKKGTFNELVDTKLKELAINQKRFGKAPGNKKENNNNDEE
ncbi:MAG: Lon protease family protein [Thermodesulfobacteriota bacterium]